jgi:hypothetical protein
MGYKGKSYMDCGYFYVPAPEDEFEKIVHDIEGKIERPLTLKEMNDLFGLTNSDELNEWFKNIQF